MVICMERGADLHTAHLMPLPLTVSCFSKIQIGFTFLVPAHLGSPRQRAVKWVSVCLCVLLLLAGLVYSQTRLSGPDYEYTLMQSIHVSMFYTIHCIWTGPDSCCPFKRVIHFDCILYSACSSVNAILLWYLESDVTAVWMLSSSSEVTEVAEPTAVVLLLSLLHNAASDSLLLHALLQLLLKVGRLFENES